MAHEHSHGHWHYLGDPRLNRLAGHPIHSDALLMAPTLLVLLFMVFWLWRVLATQRAKGLLESALVD
jgi:hypothetical protein